MKYTYKLATFDYIWLVITNAKWSKIVEMIIVIANENWVEKHYKNQLNGGNYFSLISVLPSKFDYNCTFP